jgi:hypothetical protein
MREEDKPDDIRRLVIGTLGGLLLIGGVGVAIWVVGVVRQALYQPDDIPLLQMILSADTESMGFQFSFREDKFSADGSRVLVLVVLVGFLLAAVGAIVSAMVSGGVNLLGDATWRPSLRKRKGRQED